MNQYCSCYDRDEAEGGNEHCRTEAIGRLESHTQHDVGEREFWPRNPFGFAPIREHATQDEFVSGVYSKIARYRLVGH